jgi:hypothetical protein
MAKPAKTKIAKIHRPPCVFIAISSGINNDRKREKYPGKIRLIPAPFDEVEPCTHGFNREARSQQVRFNTLKIVKSNRITTKNGMCCHLRCQSGRLRGGLLLLAFDDHDLGGLDQRRGGIADFQAQFSHRIRGNYRSDVLPANRQPDLRHQAVDLDFRDPADQLIPAADPPVIVAPFAHRAARGLHMQKLVQFRLRNSVMPASRLDRPNLFLVDPLL